MSFTEKKRDEIKKYILRKIARGDGAVLEKTMDSFGISITTVKRYIKEALEMVSLNMRQEQRKVID